MRMKGDSRNHDEDDEYEFGHNVDSHHQQVVGFRYPVRVIETPESRYHTAENTPNLQSIDTLDGENQNNIEDRRRHRQQQQQVRIRVGQVENERPPWSSSSSSSSSKKKKQMVKGLEIGLRMSETVLCLVSFCVMATDKTQGWSGDSFDRYREYRYCVGANVIGCVYSGFQACEMAYHLVCGKNKGGGGWQVRGYLDHVMDQIMAYVLISASSSAATRVIDWECNWGKDEFTHKASASIGMAFLAFLAFASSSLISLYKLPLHAS